MAKAVLARVAAPTLLIVGERDETVLAWNRESFAELRCENSRSFRPRRIFLKNPARSKRWRGSPRSGFGGGSRRVAIDQPARCAGCPAPRPGSRGYCKGVSSYSWTAASSGFLIKGISYDGALAEADRAVGGTRSLG
jgi:hypothetical protein